MRLLLIASFSAAHIDDDAIVLRARGYDVVTYFELHTRSYKHNHGQAKHTYGAHVNVLLELVNEGATLAIHPSTDPALVQEIAALCRFLGIKLIRMADLPLIAPCQGDRQWKEALTCLAARSPEEEERGLVTGAPHGTTNVEGYAPGATAQLEVATAAPARTTWQLRERLVALHRRCSDALRAADAFIGDGLKNPMTRSQRIDPLPREYRMPDAPLTATG